MPSPGEIFTSLKGYVDTPEGRLHYRRAGAGSPLVLLHQSPTSSAMWEPLLPELAARGIDAVALDLPGMGMSDPPPSPPDMPYYARRIADGIERLGLGRVDMLGHHTGTTVALTVAASRPAAVRRLVAYGVPLLDRAFARELADAAPPTFAEDAAEQLRWWRQLWAAAPGNEATVVPRTMADLLSMGARASWPHNAVGRVDHAALLAALRAPLLVLAGEREMLRRESETAAALSPWARFQALGDVGGWVADEDPVALADAVVAFLRLPDEAVIPGSVEA
jgi:pimeloyl-ACP methyl ester carboxylesterase